MPARYLLGIFDSVYLVALTAWVGSILFFSFGVAPIIFTALGSDAGGRFVRSLFPRYYLWGAISGAVALPAYVAGPLCYPEYRGAVVGVQALAILCGILIMLYAGNSLVPEINRARDAGPQGHAQFERLHRRSVRLNGLVLAIGIGLLIAFANRTAPRTSGIIELTPGQRARYDAAVDRAIEEAEIRHGFRVPRTTEPMPAEGVGTVLDEATIREIDSFYARGRQRDESGARRRPIPSPPDQGPGHEGSSDHPGRVITIPARPTATSKP